MPAPIAIRPLENYRLWVKFSDNVEGVATLADLAGKGVFALWNDYDEFKKARIGSGGEIAWNDDVDICGDAVYLRITGKTAEDLFPKLRELELRHA